MDRIVVIAAVLAIIVVVGVGLVLSSNNAGQKPSVTTPTNPGTTPSGSEPDTSVPDNGPGETNFTVITVDPAELDAIARPKVEGNCTLYKHVVDTGPLCKGYKCFGIAGMYQTFVTNEYRTAESDECYCRPTEYGCKLYMKADVHLT